MEICPAGSTWLGPAGRQGGGYLGLPP